MRIATGPALLALLALASCVRGGGADGGSLDGGSRDLAAPADFARRFDLALAPADLAGIGLFAPPITLPAGVHPSSVALGDLDRDGRLDAVVADRGANGASVFLGDGRGGFAMPVVYKAGGEPIHATIADGNGLPCVLLADFSGGVDVLLAWGDGTFAGPTSFGAGTAPDAIAAGDFNGDGHTDLAVADWGGGATILFNNGHGAYPKSASVATGANPRDIVAADLDGDGRLDLATPCWLDSSVTVMLGDRHGGFSPPTAWPAPMRPEALVAGDFDGDQRLDLAAAGGGVLALFRGHGDGTFGMPSVVQGGVDVRSLVAADFDGDGHLDLALGDEGEGGASRVTLLLGAGDGTFPATPGFDAPGGIEGLAVGDLDRDGRPDLAIASWRSGQLTVLLNRGGALRDR